jgi:hypothetical protein
MFDDVYLYYYELMNYQSNYIKKHLILSSNNLVAV